MAHTYIALTLSSVLTLCLSAEVSDPIFSGPNIAQGKTAHQYPGTWQEGDFAFEAHLAVDNNTDQNFNNHHCSSTNIAYRDKEASWDVDLGRNYYVAGLRIYNRNTLQRRLRYFRVFGYTHDLTPISIYDDRDMEQYSNSIISIINKEPVRQQFKSVRIFVHNDDPQAEQGQSILTLCEVQIFTGCLGFQKPDHSTMTDTVVTDQLNHVGSVVHFQCDQGYKLEGVTFVTCLDTGQYSSVPPRCTEICTEPDMISNGQYQRYEYDGIRKEYYDPGDNITPVCSYGFSIASGSTIRTCQPDGTWSGVAAWCKRFCSFPGVIQNGHYIFDNGSEYTDGTAFVDTVITATCQKGYSSTGAPLKRTCQYYGWSGRILNCRACLWISTVNNDLQVTYKYPTGLENWAHSNKAPHGTVAYLSCIHDLFKLSGDTQLTCGMPKPGQWSTQSKCIPLCKSPTVTNGRYIHWNGKYTEQYEAGNDITLKCNEGYQVEGRVVNRQCQQNHTWSGDPLSCNAKTCQLRAIANAAYNTTSTIKAIQFGTSISVSCNKGFFLHSGDQIRRCLSNNFLSGAPPICQIKQCQLPPTVANGAYYGINGVRTLNYKTGIAFSCKTGFNQIAGNSTRVCLDNKTWSGPEPVCQVKQCIRPSTVANGTYDIGRDYNFNYNKEIAFTCDTGFTQTVGKATRVCGDDTTWSKPEPVCQVKQCQLPPTVANGAYNINRDSVRSLNYTTEIVFSCETGFRQTDGYPTRVCLADTTWSGPEPVCREQQCQLPITVANGVYNISGGNALNYNAEIAFSCDTGFIQTEGNATRVCLNDKTWSGPEPACQAEQLPHTAMSTVTVAVIVGGAAMALVLAALGITAFIKLSKRRTHKNAGNGRYEHDTSEELGSVMRDLQSRPDTSGEEADTACCSYPGDVMKLGREIKVHDLADLVLSTDATSEKYTSEFMSFESGMTKDHTAALKHLGRNRYQNIFAYDETRVVLDVWDETTETDYINACYINGFSCPQQYIASQGATKNTLSDFWRMIWQTNSGKIVMLTNLREQGKDKCEQYWPNEGTQLYGRISVTLKHVDEFSNFVIRTLSVKKDNKDERHVVQFHFTAWPDKGVPSYCSAVVHFRSKVEVTPTTCKGPTVVHCSAGIGRTGTYIALDYLTEQGRQLGVVDVAACVELLRQQRVNMVQAKEQYVFIHRALVETLMVSTSAMPADKFPQFYQDRLTIDTLHGRRKLDSDFEMLRNTSPVAEESQYTAAQEVKHRDKNRYPHILPIEEHMPSLKGIGHSKSSGYINASFLPCYKDRNALIITQAPLAKTKEDFWKMVYSQKVHTIVMMNSLTDLQTNEIYWPQKGEVRIADMEITHTRSEHVSCHLVLTLTVKRKGTKRDLKLIQFGKWDTGSQVPDGPSNVLAAIELVQDWQRQTGNHAVVVHCMDGAERSGLFCVLYALLERTKIEHDVAITQVIQEMRNRRAQLIPNVAQFQFCHETVLEFLKQFDTYSNFSSV